MFTRLTLSNALVMSKLNRAPSGKAIPINLISPSEESRPPPTYSCYLSLAGSGGPPLERAASVPEHCNRVAVESTSPLLIDLTGDLCNENKASAMAAGILQ